MYPRRLADANGIDTLLQAVASYKNREPGSAEEEEFMQVWYLVNLCFCLVELVCFTFVLMLCLMKMTVMCEVYTAKFEQAGQEEGLTRCVRLALLLCVLHIQYCFLIVRWLMCVW